MAWGARVALSVDWVHEGNDASNKGNRLFTLASVFK